ncbi:MAG: putative sugar nucleotidyl transferase [Flavobacteriales bacterium]
MPVGFRTEAYLAERFPGVAANVVREVDAALLPTPGLVDAVLDLEPGRMLVKDGRVLAFCE